MQAPAPSVRIVLRRLRSAAVMAAARLRSMLVRFNAHTFQEGITIATSVHFGRNVAVSATDGGSIEVGRGSGIGTASRLVAREGRISVAPDVFIGDGCIVVSLASIEIGAGTQIAEYVVIRDHDHDVTRRPFASARFKSEAIVIGKDCWIGAKATILKGARIGDGAVIGAHSVVRGTIPPHSLAVGAPARVVKTFPPAARDAEHLLQPEASDVAV